MEVEPRYAAWIVRTDAYDYDLPFDRIAQEPERHRDASRLLVLRRDGAPLEHRVVRDLPALLEPGDLLVVNDTRVLHARLLGRRATGGRVEVLLLASASGETWTALVRPAGRVVEGERIAIDGGGAVILGTRRGEDARWTVRAETGGLPELMERAGHVPLPPYIRREDRPEDRDRYQTMFASVPGAVAAPTAGLHFTPDLVDALAARGVDLATITLHVGPGSFRPVTAARLEDHRIDPEPYHVPPATAVAIERTRAFGGRVVAVGTTVVRTIETVAAGGLRTGETDLTIHEPYRFRWVDALLTNFHLPRTTLVALVAAHAGRERLLAAYREAVATGYRFYSYGDAMLVL